MAENNKQLQEAKKLLEEINLLRAKLNQAPLKMTDGDAVQNIQSLRNELRGVQKSFEDVDSSATSLYDQVRAISSEFKNQPGALQKIRGSMKKITSIAEDLKMQEQGIRDLSLKQLDDLSQRLKENKKLLDDETERLLRGEDLSELAQKDLKDLQDYLKSQGDITKLTQEQVDEALEMVNIMGNLTAEQKAALSNYIDQGNALDKINEKIEEEKEHQKEINKLMGVGGAVIGGIDGLMSKLGMNSGIFKQRVEEANDAMKAQAEKIKAGVASGGKLSVLMAGLGPLAKGFGQALLDPLSIILKIVDAFFKVDKASTDVQRLTGQNTDAIAGANMRYATSVDYLETVAELTRQTGMNAQNIFSPDVIAGAAELKNTMGLAADEAGGLAMIAQTTNGDIEATVDSIVDQTTAFNKSKRSAVNQKQVLQDVAKASDGIKASLGGNPKLIAAAAASARRLGMELGKIDQIASSLLDFEDSISKEMEAELLIGKDLNLNKARELALNNDLAGLGDELFKNAADISEFGKMNRIQQESYAAALGMTRDELGKIAYQKAIEAGMTEEQAEAAAGVRAEDMKRAEIQEQIQKSLDKLAQAFAPILSIIGDIVGVFAPIVQIIGGAVGHVVKLLDTLGIIKPLIIGIVAIMAAGKIAGFFGTMTRGFLAVKDNIKGLDFSLSGMKDKFKSIGDSAKDFFKGVKGKFTDGLKGVKPDKAQEVAKSAPEIPEAATKGVDKTVEASNAASKAQDPKSSGEKLKEFFTNLAAGLKEMASTKVVGGALALIPASAGLILFAPGYLGAKLIEKLDGEKLQAGLVSLATGLKEMGSGTVAAGAAVLMAASLGFITFIAGYPGATLLQKLDSKKLKESLSSMASGLSELGSGKALLGALGLVLAGAGFVVLTAGIPAMAFLAVFGGALGGALTSLGEGLASLGKALANGKVLLGLAAFTLVAIGLGYALSIAAPGIEAIGNVIMKVMAGIPPIIQAVADGFTQLMGSLTLENIGAFFLLGPALTSAAFGITAFAIALAASSAASGVNSLLGGGILSDLQTLVEMAGPLQTVAGSLTAIALALGGIGTALATMETEKLEEMQDLITTAAFAGPAISAVGAIGDMISGIAGGGNGESSKSEGNDKLIAKIDELIVAVKQGKNINMDGRKVGNTLRVAATNT